MTLVCVWFLHCCYFLAFGVLQRWVRLQNESQELLFSFFVMCRRSLGKLCLKNFLKLTSGFCSFIAWSRLSIIITPGYSLKYGCSISSINMLILPFVVFLIFLVFRKRNHHSIYRKKE